MPDLLRTLQGNDLGFLRMVAQAWGLELNAPDAHTALPALVNGIRNPALIAEVIDALPRQAQIALQALLENEGRIPWATFARRHGEVRSMGAARRDRERPDLKPASPAEILWYRALIGKAFLAGDSGEPQEYAYIPDDLIEFLQPLSAAAPQPPGRPASPAECAAAQPASDALLDQSCTLLAACRLSMPLETLPAGWALPPATLAALLQTAGLLDKALAPRPEPVRAFLEASRGEALARLVQAWMHSTSFNELRLLPGLKCEGNWQNDPLRARQAILDQVSHLPQERWWNLAAFVAAIHDRQPDFQRPAGDYDSWFIRQETSGAYLRGFASWDEVDGALIRYLITVILPALGLVELAAPQAGSAPAAFRLSPWAAALWGGAAPPLPAENASLRLNAEGHLRLPPLTPRSARYQIARFCQWEDEQGGEQRYRLTPAALERARQQGLRPSHLLGLLRRHSAAPLPPTLVQALERWEQFGVQAGLEQVSLLRVAAPEMLSALRKSRAARCLGEALNPTTALVRPGCEAQVLAALAELGYLGECK